MKLRVAKVDPREIIFSNIDCKARKLALSEEDEDFKEILAEILAEEKARKGTDDSTSQKQSGKKKGKKGKGKGGKKGGKAKKAFKSEELWHSNNLASRDKV